MRLLASLRTRIVVIVLLGTVLPLAIVALWQVREVQQFGERLLRERLDESLQRVAGDVGARWAAHRSALLTLGEYAAASPVTRRNLGADVQADASLAAVYAQVRRAASVVTFHGERGVPAWTLVDAATNVVAPRGQPGAAVRASVEIFDRRPGRRLGTLNLQIPMSSLLPAGAGDVASIGAVLAAIDGATGEPLTPLPFSPPRDRDEFIWAGERWLVARASIGEPPLDLVAAAPVAPFSEPYERAARRAVTVLALVLVAALATTTVWTRRTLRSLRDLAGAATEIAQGRYDHTVTPGADDEVGQLARAFNTMTASLRRSIDELSERRSLAAVGELAAALAHEVRNPLTSIRLDLQRVEEKVAGDARLLEPVTRALRSVVRLDATVGGVLKVAKSSPTHFLRLDVRAPLEAAMRDLEPEFRARGVRVACEGVNVPRGIEGDSAALHQMFLNLLLNAVQATGTGGHVEISVTSDDDHVEVAITDDGPGIGDDEQRRAFEPLYSTKPDGTGLGLAIARRIVEAHRGMVVLESDPGRGTTVRMRIPRPAGA